MTIRSTLPLVIALAALAGCGSDDGRGGISAEDDRRLNEAAAMLEDNMFDTSADSLVANAEELETLESEEANAAANLR